MKNLWFYLPHKYIKNNVAMLNLTTAWLPFMSRTILFILTSWKGLLLLQMSLQFNAITYVDFRQLGRYIFQFLYPLLYRPSHSNANYPINIRPILYRMHGNLQRMEPWLSPTTAPVGFLNSVLNKVYALLCLWLCY